MTTKTKTSTPTVVKIFIYLASGVFILATGFAIFVIGTGRFQTGTIGLRTKEERNYLYNTEIVEKRNTGLYKETRLGNHLMFVREVENDYGDEVLIDNHYDWYMFDLSTGDMVLTRTHWRYDLPDVLPETISKSEIESTASEMFGLEINYSRIVLISEDSKMYQLPEPPVNPTWVVYLDNKQSKIFDSVTGDFLGDGPTLLAQDAYLTSGPESCNPPIVGEGWPDLMSDAEEFISSMNYDTGTVSTMPSKNEIEAKISNEEVAVFYTIGHTGYEGAGIITGCSGNDDEILSVTDIAIALDGYPKMPFTYLASCDGMCDTGEFSLAQSFTKGVSEDAAVVGFCGMAESSCADCWNNIYDWQWSFFSLLSEGNNVGTAFTGADASVYNECTSCIDYYGDPELKLVPKISRRSFSGSSPAPSVCDDLWENNVCILPTDNMEDPRLFGIPTDDTLTEANRIMVWVKNDLGQPVQDAHVHLNINGACNFCYCDSLEVDAITDILGYAEFQLAYGGYCNMPGSYAVRVLVDNQPVRYIKKMVSADYNNGTCDGDVGLADFTVMGNNFQDNTKDCNQPTDFNGNCQTDDLEDYEIFSQAWDQTCDYEYLKNAGEDLGNTDNEELPEFMTPLPDPGVYCGGLITGDTVLTEDLDCSSNSSGLKIGSSDITLDCNGHSIIGGENSGTGIKVGTQYPAEQHYNNISIINCTIKNYDNGIWLIGTSDSLINMNTISSRDGGILLHDSDNNDLIGNKIVGASDPGAIFLSYDSEFNNIASNEACYNDTDIDCWENPTVNYGEQNKFHIMENCPFIENLRCENVCLSMDQDYVDNHPEELKIDHGCVELQEDIVTNTAIILGDNVTFNCNNNSITSPGSDAGFLLDHTESATIENCEISGFYTQIQLLYSSGNTIINNTLDGNGYLGINATNSPSNTITANTLQSNTNIKINYSPDNTITENTLGNYSTIYLFGDCQGSTLNGNTSCNNVTNDLVCYPEDNSVIGYGNQFNTTLRCSNVEYNTCNSENNEVALNNSFEVDYGFDYFPDWDTDNATTGDSLPDGWYSNTTFPGVIDDSEIHDGQYSVKIERDTQNTANAYSFQDIPVENGKTYRVSGYVKTDQVCTADDECFATIITECRNADHDIQYNCGLKLTSDKWQKRKSRESQTWTKIDFTVTADNPNAEFLRVLCYNTPHETGDPLGEGTIWCDNIEVKEYEIPETCGNGLCEASEACLPSYNDCQSSPYYACTDYECNYGECEPVYAHNCEQFTRCQDCGGGSDRCICYQEHPLYSNCVEDFGQCSEE
ncbi:right-handed parallel beta-helix repeat-containing protein [Patescibacteria group bacterium]|nr:right-handed parallel beta-helix repeat-containing protein [Patescibacteria group bacterium]MBU1889870.1 right-handed parallel beta-helix repeat-containing protein [Patescibacteria group bacterium]